MLNARYAAYFLCSTGVLCHAMALQELRLVAMARETMRYRLHVLLQH